ncbi:MAG: NAD(P)-dependent oxidoreductase [Thermoplasmatales archaeon]
MRVLITGANGKIGRALFQYLLSKEYDVFGIDIDCSNILSLPHMKVDLLHEGQVYQTVSKFDAVIHLASYHRPGLVPDTLTFQNNVNALHNVLNSSMYMGIKKVLVASSVAVYGFRYSDLPVTPNYLPIDEDYPCAPVDSYGLSKLIGEFLADSFSKRGNINITSFRIPQVVVNFDGFEARSSDPSGGIKKLWLYIDIRDVLKAFELALVTNTQGHRIINISAADTDQTMSTLDLIHTYYPNVKIKTPLLGNETLLNINKAREILGFIPKYSWRTVYKYNNDVQ